MLHSLYRISDASRINVSVENITKINCLKNFIRVFGIDGLYVFADNCQNETIEQIIALGIKPVCINLGNSGSFRYIVNFALKNFNENDDVYLIEDDYWHLPQAKKVLIEGLKLADYVTLYDHPDKYVNFNDGGSNPYIECDSEECRVVLSRSSHWKTTNSTTMTFATKVSTLKSDKPLLWKVTETSSPTDFVMHAVLTKQDPLTLLKNADFKNAFFDSLAYYFDLKKRKLISALPGLSTHLEVNWLCPLYDWPSIIEKDLDTCN